MKIHHIYYRMYSKFRRVYFNFKNNQWRKFRDIFKSKRPVACFIYDHSYKRCGIKLTNNGLVVNPDVKCVYMSEKLAKKVISNTEIVSKLNNETPKLFGIFIVYKMLPDVEICCYDNCDYEYIFPLFNLGNTYNIVDYRFFDL